MAELLSKNIFLSDMIRPWYSRLFWGIRKLSLPNPQRDLHCYCLGLDIVGYSNRATSVQCEMVTKIHQIVENAQALHSVKRRQMLFLPTGDGMIISLISQDHTPMIMIDLAKEIQHVIKKQNEKLNNEEKIILRMGLHSGTGSSYIDINSSINIAGTVANTTQRITSFGDDWHVLATKNAYDDIGTLSTGTRNIFHKLGIAEAKHKNIIEVYNVYEEGEHIFGNPEKPEQVKPFKQDVETEVVS